MDQKFPKDYFRLKGMNAEAIVHKLATKTFLIDWCFLNPKLPNGRELCDLLVIFDEIAIIWQIKDLKLNKEGKYKKAEVDKNLRQIIGARRQLFDLKTPVRLQNVRRKEEILDPSTIKRIFLISVLLGEGEEMFSFVDEIKNNKVHVFTRNFTQIVLSELDTVSDFVDYLTEKELLISTKKQIVIMGGEEELLAMYLMNERSFGILKEADCVMIDEGSWECLQNKPEYKEKKKADMISYGWDDIINRAHEGSEKYELVARELARPNRFWRRCLGKRFLEAHIIAHKDEKHDIIRRMMPTDGVTYCFLFQDDIEPREGRKKMLASICYIARGKYPENKKVLGIATERKIQRTCTYDFAFFDWPIWTEENQNNMEKLQKESGVFTNPIISRMHEDEYPGTK